MKLKSLLAVSVLGFATMASANVSMEMFQLNKQMGTLVNATSTEEFQESAAAFIKAAQEARAKLPKSLSNAQDRFDGYQKAMDELIETAMIANDLAGQGKLDEAKETAKKLNQLKKQYHSEYK